MDLTVSDVLLVLIVLIQKTMLAGLSFAEVSKKEAFVGLGVSH